MSSTLTFPSTPPPSYQTSVSVESWCARKARWYGACGRLMGSTPRSGYSKEAVPTNSYYGQAVTGTIGIHLPKEIIRIERDWSDGEVCQ